MTDEFDTLPALDSAKDEFDDLAVNPVDQPKAPQEQERPRSSLAAAKNLVMDIAAGVNKGSQSLRFGVAGPITKAVGLGGGAENVKQREQAEFQQAAQRSPIATQGASIASSIAPATLVPGGVAGKLGHRLLSGSAAGAGIGLVQDAPNVAERAQNALLGGLIGGASLGAIAGAGKAAKTVKTGVKNLTPSFRTIKQLSTGQYRQLLIEILSKPKHAKNLEKISMIKNISERNKKLAALISKIAAQKSTE